MGSLFAALGSAGEALRAFEQSVDVTQNNVSNANSPGYAKQVALMDSLAFQPSNGLMGGVKEQTEDTRNQFAETAVQQQTSLLGEYQQLQTSLAPIQSVFDVSSNSPIPSALNQLFASFSAWSTSPSDPNSQNAVLTAAGTVATAFQQASSQLAQIRSSTDSDLKSTVAQINQDAATIQSYNVAVTQETSPDAGLQAQLYSAIDDLSNFANVQVVPGNGGTVTVLLGGQTPLVIGTQVNALQVQYTPSANATNPNAPPGASIVDSHGVDVTSQVSSGALAGLLSVRNDLIPSLIGDDQQTGDLNTLAKSLADTVNNALAQGSTTATPPYQSGAPLFTYNASSANLASTLQVNPSLTPDQLAAVDPGPPVVSNGTALNLAGLDSDPAGQINGLSFTGFFASLATRVGNAAQQADTNEAAQSQLVAQATNLRQQLSGVSLDDEAVTLVQLQRSYQAASKVVNVVDELTQTILNMVQ